MLRAQGLIKRFAGRAAVAGMTFDVPAGQVVGFLGPNGAGKTTTMRLLTGFLPADAGRAEVAGVDVAARPLEARRRLGYLPEDNPLYEELEVVETLEYAARLRGLDGASGSARLRDVVRRCGLKPVVGRRVWELSRGFRQRLGLAQAIVHEGRVVADGAPGALGGGAPRRRLRVELKAPRDAARAALAALPGAAACADEGEGFSLDADVDLREAVFRLAVERGWALLRLAEERPSLQDVFRELTRLA